MKNKCIDGVLNGMEFQISTPATKITYRDGYYLKSALREGQETTLWVWHNNNEKPAHPINPN